VIDQEEPPPTSVDEVVSPIERLLRLEPTRPPFFPWLKDQLRGTPPFFRDSMFNVNLRSYYLDKRQSGVAEKVRRLSADADLPTQAENGHAHQEAQRLSRAAVALPTFRQH
jgi:hypothetical protein